jgi:tetratricopeptide (TPR) repeat protein
MGMDEPLSEVVNGTWDIAAAAAEFKKGQEQDLAMMAFSRTLRTASNNEDWDGYIAAIDSYTAEFGEDSQLKMMKFNALLTGKNDTTAAYALAEEIVEADWNNANALNGMAWGIVDETPSEYQNLDFALKVAERACELTDYQDSMILDTLARCYWEMGDRYKAIAWQEKAVEYSNDSSMGDSIQATLDEYQSSLANVDE